MSTIQRISSQTSSLLEQFLQNVALFFGHLCFSGVFIFGNIFFFRSMFTSWYFIPLLYVAWVIFYPSEHSVKHVINRFTKGGREGRWFRTMRIWKYYAGYFPAALHKTCDLDPKKNYIMGYHPHGCICTGAFATLGTTGCGVDKVFPGMRFYALALNTNFYIPFSREIWLWNGICSADKESVEHILTRMGTGNVLITMIGGVTEVFDAVPNTMNLTLKNRKGFVRLAITHGVSLIPCLCFGENELFNQQVFPKSSKVYKIQMAIKKWLTFGAPLISGRFLNVPLQRALNTVGKMSLQGSVIK